MFNQAQLKYLKENILFGSWSAEATHTGPACCSIGICFGTFNTPSRGPAVTNHTIRTLTERGKPKVSPSHSTLRAAIWLSLSLFYQPSSLTMVPWEMSCVTFFQVSVPVSSGLGPVDVAVRS